MAKKAQENEQNVRGTAAQDDFSGPVGDEGISMDTDFNVEDEYKPDPLIPQATYHASVTKVVFDPDQQAIVWHFCLVDNGGVMSDGETPVDGATTVYRNWLPRPGDENELNATRDRARSICSNSFLLALVLICPLHRSSLLHCPTRNGSG